MHWPKRRVATGQTAVLSNTMSQGRPSSPASPGTYTSGLVTEKTH